MSVAELPGEEFVGYTFLGAPPRRPRLWFLDRHIHQLCHVCGWSVSGSGTWGDPDPFGVETGTWTSNHLYLGGESFVIPPGGRSTALHLRYEHYGHKKWTAVWRVTETHIPHVHTFGREDDVWRLCVWPD